MRKFHSFNVSHIVQLDTNYSQVKGLFVNLVQTRGRIGDHPIRR